MAADTPPEAENLDVSETPDAAEPPKGGKGKKIVVLAAVLLATAAGGGVAYSQFGSIDRTAEGFFGSSEEEADEDAPIEYGEFMQIDGLVVNPAGTGGARYLMVSIGLESAEPAVLEEVGAKDIVVRDAIISHLSGKDVDTLADITNREGIKEEIRTLLNGILSEGAIDRLYFTQFMLQ